MKKLPALILLSLATACFGQNVTFRNLAPSQFGSNAYVVYLKSGVLVTNLDVRGTLTATNANPTNFFGAGYVNATGFIGDGSLLSGLPGGGDVTTAQLNSASNVLFAATVSSTGAVSIASSLNATQGLASALGAIYATDAELASATNAATLASSVNATNAGNIAFKPANNAFGGSNNFGGNTTFGLPPLGSGEALTNIPRSAVTGLETGLSYLSNNIGGTAFWFTNPAAASSVSNDFNVKALTVTATQMLITAASPAGSYVMIGTANSLSNTIVSVSGSNDISLRAGFNTNSVTISNNLMTVHTDTVFERSMTGNGNNVTNVLEKNVAVSTNSTLGGQTVDFSRGTMQLTNFPAGNVTLDAITGFTTSNLNWVTYDIQPDAAAVRTLTVNASWFVSGFTNATVVAITNGQWAELTITAIIGRRTNASIVFWQ